MKNCFKCFEEKPLSGFYKHPQMPDGHLNKRKECTKKDVREGRKQRFEQYSEYEKRRYRDNSDRRKKLQEIGRKWRIKNPLAYKAQTAVGNALRSKKLEKKPCLFCGADKNIHAHHNDYTKPLDVVWLCAKCHHRAHAHFPQIQGHGQATNA